MDGLLRNCATGCRVDDVFTMDDLVDSISADTSGLRCGHAQLRIVFITQLNNNKAGESHAAKMRIVSNGVQPYIVQTGVDTDGETQEEVTTFRMKLDVSEWLVDKFM
ncbi:hypothetical protein DPX16_7212 [Anabarilius grahami]|uniref:Uncharacterized protein n=1 Tax=Anabarilius grahami TaxID=495550 RepID=A0A3N0XMS3_ANAGA|nr:hypothetical protein DPX16_7212 [Anabarilius grahami]